MSFTIEHDVQITGADAYERLAASQEKAVQSTKKLDASLTQVQSTSKLAGDKLKALLGSGDITPKLASKIQSDVAALKKYGFSVDEAFKVIAKSGEQYGDAEAKLSQRLLQSANYRISIQKRAAQEAAAVRQQELSSLDTFSARLKAKLDANAASFAASAKSIQAEGNQVLSKRLANIVNKYASTSTTGASNAANSEQGRAIQALESLISSGSVNSSIGQVLRSGLTRGVSVGGAGVGVSGFLSSLTSAQGGDQFSRDLSVAAKLLTSKLSNAAPAIEEVTKESFNLSRFLNRRLFNIASQASILVPNLPGAFGISRSIRAAGYLGQEVGAIAPGGGSGGGGRGVGGVGAAAAGAGGAEGAGLLGGISGGALAFGATAAAAVAAGAVLLHFADSTAKLAQEDTNLALKTGLTVTQIGELRGAAALAGVPVDELAIAFRGLSEGLENTRSPQAQALKDLGISGTDTVGRLRPTIDILKEISAQVRSVDDIQARDLIDKIIPGRGAALLPLFRRDLTSLIEEAKKLGVAFTEDGAHAADLYEQRLEKLDLRWQALKRSFGEHAIAIIEFVVPSDEQIKKTTELDRKRLQRRQAAAAYAAGTGPRPEDEPLETIDTNAFLASQSGIKEARAAAQYDLQKQQQARDESTPEGLRDKLSRAQSALADALKKRDAPITDSTNQAALGKGVTDAQAEVERIKNLIREQTEAKAEQKKLQEELNKAQEGELFGSDKINQTYTDRLKLLEEEGIATTKNKELLLQIRDVELERDQIRQRIDRDKQTDKEQTALTTAQSDLAIAQANSKTAIDRAGNRNQSPEQIRDQALADAKNLRDTATTVYENTISTLERQQKIVQDERAAKIISPEQYDDKSTQLRVEGLEAQKKRALENNKADEDAAKALAAFKLAKEDELASKRKEAADEELARQKAIASISDQFTLQSTRRQISLLNSTGDFTADSALAIQRNAARAKLNTDLGRISTSISTEQAVNPVDNKGREEQQKRLNDLQIQGAEALAAYYTTIYDLRLEQEEALAKYQQDQIKFAEDLIGKVYDAGVTKGSRGVGAALAEEGRGILKQSVVNTGGLLFSKLGGPNLLGSIIPGQTKTNDDGTTSLTTIGKILQKTPLAAPPPKVVDPHVISIDTNLGLSQKDIAAILALLQKATGITVAGASSTASGATVSGGNSSRGGFSLPSFSRPGGGGGGFSISDGEALGSAALGFGIDPATGFNSRIPLSNSSLLSAIAGVPTLDGTVPGILAPPLPGGDFSGASYNSDYSGGGLPAPSAASAYDTTPSLIAPTATPQANSPAADLKTASTSLATLSKALGGGSGIDLSGILTGVGAGPNGIGAQSYTNSQRLAGAAGAAAGVAGGVGTAIAGFKKGGVSGDAQGVAGTLASGAAVASLFGPAGAPIAAGLAIASVVASGISAILGDPRAKRSADINKELQLGTYIAPVSQNRTSDLSGNFAQINNQGKVQTTNFSDIPIIQEGYFDRQRNVIPGTTYSPFGYQPGSNPAVTPNPNTPPAVNVSITAMDSQSIETALTKDPSMTNRVLDHALSRPGPAQARIRGVANGIS